MKFDSVYFLFLLLVIPLLPFLSRGKGKDRYVRFSMAGIMPSSQAPKSLKIQKLLNALIYPILILLVITMARPQMIMAGKNIPAEGIDMVLVIDVSGSMKSLDVLPKELRPADQKENERYQDTEDRLSKVKKVARNFVSNRKDDRIGIVAFAGRSVVVSPLTNDYRLLDKLLMGLNFDLITDGTTVGNAITSAVTMLKESERKSRAILMLTDGLNNAGDIEPAQGAYFARHYGIKLYPIEMGSFAQNSLALQQNEQDANLLPKIALFTGGKHFVIPTADYLYSVYSEIERIEKTSIEEKGLPSHRELFPYFLLFALLMLVGRFVLLNTRYRSLP